jgi:YD repeat-containing protein
MAPPSVTALSGQVLRLNGLPLANVTLQIGDRTTKTDRSGRFLLAEIPTGYHMLIMDGTTANRPGRTYGIFDYGVYPQAGRTKVLPFTIWMPLLDTQHAMRIPVPTPREIVVTSPRIPDLEVRIPENVVLQTSAGPLQWMSLTQIPVDRPPFPLPEGADFFFTPQAHGAQVLRPDGSPSPKGVRMILPNKTGLPAGLLVDLKSYETGNHGWYVYGQGRVTRDARQIVPEAEVEFFVVKCAHTMGPAQTGEKPVLAGVRVGDPVDPATGLFVYEKTDLVIPDVIPIVITRKYRQLDAEVRPFGLGMSHDYQMFLAGDTTTFTYAELVLGDGSRIRYDRTSAGTGHTDAIMEATDPPTGFFKSRLSWDAGLGGWQILMQDGTIYRFVNSFPGPYLSQIQDRAGNRLTITRIASVFGFPGGNPHPDVRISRITSPNGRWVDFSYGADDKVTQLKDNAGRTVTYTYTSGRMTSVTDVGGGVTEYTYDASQRMQTIEDARNIVFLTNEYDAASRVIRQTQADSTTWEYPTRSTPAARSSRPTSPTHADTSAASPSTAPAAC